MKKFEKDFVKDDTSLDSDEREFIDHISWDTDSDEEDVAEDDRMIKLIVTGGIEDQVDNILVDENS